MSIFGWRSGMGVQSLNPLNRILLGTASKPEAGYLYRVVPVLSNKHCTLSLETETRHTLFTATTKDVAIFKDLHSTANTSACVSIARLLSKWMKDAGLTRTQFNFGNRRYLGKPKILFDTMHAEGIRFRELYDIDPARALQQIAAIVAEEEAALKKKAVEARQDAAKKASAKLDTKAVKKDKKEKSKIK